MRGASQVWHFRWFLYSSKPTLKGPILMVFVEITSSIGNLLTIWSRTVVLIWTTCLIRTSCSRKQGRPWKYRRKGWGLLPHWFMWSFVPCRSPRKDTCIWSNGYQMWWKFSSEVGGWQAIVSRAWRQDRCVESQGAAAGIWFREGNEAASTGSCPGRETDCDAFSIVSVDTGAESDDTKLRVATAVI